MVGTETGTTNQTSNSPSPAQTSVRRQLLRNQELMSRKMQSASKPSLNLKSAPSTAPGCASKAQGRQQCRDFIAHHLRRHDMTKVQLQAQSSSALSRTCAEGYTRLGSENQVYRGCSFSAGSCNKRQSMLETSIAERTEASGPRTLGVHQLHIQEV